MTQQKNLPDTAPSVLGTFAIDQHGTTYHNLGPYPRKALLQRLCRTRAEKMYVDTTAGKTKHVGYVIAGHWLRLYYLAEWTGRRRLPV